AGDGIRACHVTGIQPCALPIYVHALKALVRPVLNAMTACLAAPMASAVEDTVSLTMSLVALLIPVLVILFVPALFLTFWWLLRRRRRRKAAAAASSGSCPAGGRAAGGRVKMKGFSWHPHQRAVSRWPGWQAWVRRS